MERRPQVGRLSMYRAPVDNAEMLNVLRTEKLTTPRVLSIVAAAALLLGILLPSRGLYGIDVCAFHHLTGIPCPGCGMTRAFTALSHGHFAQAWALHPFVFPIYASALLFLAAPLWVRYFPKLRTDEGQRRLGTVGTAMGIAMLIFGVARMFRFYPWP